MYIEKKAPSSIPSPLFRAQSVGGILDKDRGRRKKDVATGESWPLFNKAAISWE